MTRCPLFLTLLTAIILCIPLLHAQSESPKSESEILISNCRDALKLKSTGSDTEQLLESLIKQIKNKENLYLKSSLYLDVRSLYIDLNAKLGNLYYQRHQFKNALHCFQQANNYSTRGYHQKILECKQKSELAHTLKLNVENGISFYRKELFEIAQSYFLLAVQVDYNASRANRLKNTAFEYLNKISEWKKIITLTPWSYYLFKLNNPNSIIMTELKQKLKEKFPALPPDSFIKHLYPHKNSSGFWEANITGHIMVYIPKTPYGPMWADKYEVSYAQLERLRKFKKKRIKSGIPSINSASPNQPAMVTFKEAKYYSIANGFQLPTEAQWEMLAGKAFGYKYPWGNENVDADGIYRANYDDSLQFRDGFMNAAPVKSFSNYPSPYGLINLAGNAWEWVISHNHQKCKGGSYLSTKDHLKITASSSAEQLAGFRCIMILEKKNDR
jgi:hypothetical protein